jgi:hypothetical protein
MKATAKRLEELRTEIRAERISYGEIAELQSLAQYIEPGDVELLQWAGVPEQDSGEQRLLAMRRRDIERGSFDDITEENKR